MADLIQLGQKAVEVAESNQALEDEAARFRGEIGRLVENFESQKRDWERLWETAEADTEKRQREHETALSQLELLVISDHKLSCLYFAQLTVRHQDQIRQIEEMRKKELDVRMGHIIGSPFL